MVDEPGLDATEPHCLELLHLKSELSLWSSMSAQEEEEGGGESKMSLTILEHEINKNGEKGF